MVDQRYLIGIACAVMLLSACDKKPGGQVAAVVNGEEITIAEINAEVGVANIPKGVDLKQIRAAALQRIVDRRLLAQSARDEELDKTPEYLIRSRQLDEALLVELLRKRAEKTFQIPDQRALNKFMAENPAMFADRQIFTVDRIQFAFPADMDQLKSLENDHSMDAVAAKLTTLGIKFERGLARMDSAQLGQQRINQIKALPEGEPFVILNNGVVTVAVIKSKNSVTLNAAEMGLVATQAMRNQAVGMSHEDRLKLARASGKIEYQVDFLPRADRNNPSKP